jgi:hypothetical protein
MNNQDQYIFFLRFLQEKMINLCRKTLTSMYCPSIVKLTNGKQI